MGGCRMTFPGWGTPRWVNWVSWFACASIRSEPMATASASLNQYSVFLSFTGSIIERWVWKKEDYYLVRYRRTNRMLLGNSLVSFCINEWKDWFCNGNFRIPALLSSSNFFPQNWRRASWRKRLVCLQMPLTKILLTRPCCFCLSQRLS